jgi:uncharacterized protein (DUF362 family)
MGLHPLLRDAASVLVVHQAVPRAPGWEEFRGAAIAALEAARVSIRDAKVVIKPNFTSGEHGGDPDSGIMTHAGFVWGVIDHVKRAGARRGGVTVLEDPRDSDDNEPRHWRGTGMPEVAERTGVKLRCPTSYTCTEKQVPHPLVHATRKVSRLVVDPETVFLNVPKLKTHNLTVTTLCMKNLMGVVNVWDRHYCSQAFGEMPPDMGNGVDRTWAGLEHSHRRLAMRLADLAKVARPALNVVEGVVGRDGSGFARGRNYPTGLVVLGINMVAVDTVASWLMGFDPARIVYLQVAADAGLGPAELSRIKILVQRDGKIVRAPDPEELRAARPFRVFAGVRGYDAYVRGP